MKNKWLLPLVNILALIPLAWMLADFFLGNLSINPIQELTFRTGEASLRILMLSLACTPVHILFGWRWALPLRKPLGLYAFMYGCLHFLVFTGLDFGFNLELIVETTFEKRFALVGFAALVLMTPLAITSNRWSMRRLGKNWKRLHQVVYLCGILIILHFLWARKLALDPEALIYGLVLLLLLAVRIPPVRKAIRRMRGKK